MTLNILSPQNLMDELKARFPETYINVELSFEIYRSGSKEIIWRLCLSGDDVNISQKFNSFPNLLSYANHLIAMQQAKTEAPVFRFNTN